MSTHRAIIAVSVRPPVTTRTRVSAFRTNAMSAVAPAARHIIHRQRSRAHATLTARCSATSRGVAGIAGMTVIPGPGGLRANRGRVAVVTRAAKKKRSPEEIRARREARERREAEEAELAAFEAEEAAPQGLDGEDTGEDGGFEQEDSLMSSGEGEEMEEEEKQAPAPTRSANELRPRSASRSSQYRSSRSPPEPQEEGPDVVLIGGAAAAVAAVGYFLWQKKNGGGGGGGGEQQQPPATEGGMTLGEMGMSSAQMGGGEGMGGGGDNIPVGVGSFAGMPTFTEGGEDGGAGQPKQPRQIKGEFKRNLREMMNEMRRFDTVDLHGRNLGDEGATYISEALAFNDVATCIDFGANGIGPEGVAALCTVVVVRIGK